MITTNVPHGLESGDVVGVASEEYLAEVVSDREFQAIPVREMTVEEDEAAAASTSVSGLEEKRKKRSMSGQVSLKIRKRAAPANMVSRSCFSNYLHS